MDGKDRQDMRYADSLIADLKTVIKHDINSGVERTSAMYLDVAMDTLKTRYQMYHRRSRYAPWSKEGLEDITRLWMGMKPEIVAAIDKFQEEFRRKKIAKDIQATAAKAAVSIAMEEVGLPYSFEGQTHRAKVSVLITGNKALTVYISYKKVNEQLPSIVESIKIIRREIEKLGPNTSIRKPYFGEFA